MATSSNYTSDEVQAVVEKLVLSTISRPLDSLGVRRTDVTFTDIQQAAAGVFVLYPNSPFYVVGLGLKRLLDAINSEAALIDQLEAAISAVGRQVLPVNDVTTLFNAQAALQELGTAASSRSGVYTDITKAPAYQRFSTNLASFLAGPGQAVRSGGNIVQTPQQAQAALSGLVSQVETAHSSLVASVALLANALTNYGSVNLPSVVISSVLSNAAALVGSDATALNALNPTDRLTLIRQTVLNAIAAKAAVDSFGTFTGPSDYYSLSGIGMPYSDASHLADAAVLVGTKSGGFSIIAGTSDDLNITADGGSPFDVVLTASQLASLDGSADDSGFIIGNGVTPSTPNYAVPNNNSFKFKVDSTSYVAPLTLSGAATPATITGTADITASGLYGGGGLLDGKTLSLAVDGTTSYSVTLVAPPNALALFTQINAVIHPGGAHDALSSLSGINLQLQTLNAGQGSSLYIGPGTANAYLGLTAGQLATGSSSPRTADQVAADINVVAPAGVAAEGFYFPLRFTGLFNIPAGTNTTWTVVGSTTSLLTLGVSVGDTVHVLSGANAGIYSITAVTSNSVTVSGTFTAQSSAPTESGPKNRRLRLQCTNPAVQLPAETTLTIYGDDTPSKNVLVTLGFINNISSSCQQTTADVVAADINQKTGVIAASTQATSVATVATAHTDISDPTHVVLSEAGATGSQAFAGTTLTFTVAAISLAGNVSSGDVLALRSGPNVSAYYTITTINGSSASSHPLAVGDVVVATGTVAGSAASGVSVEFGPSVSITKYRQLVIPSGPNNGSYFIKAQGATPLDVLLFKALPAIRSGATYVSMSVSVADLYLVLSSTNTTTLSRITVQGDGASLFFSSVPSTANGTTPWFQLPSFPRGLQASDVLELYPTVYNIPGSSYTVIQASSDTKLLQLSPAIDSTTSWQFSAQPPPFAKLRLGTMNNFSQVQSALNAWLANSVNQPLFFENFNRLINPLLYNTNPTASQVGAAQAALNSLYAYLLAAQATAQGAPASQALDAIVQTYTVEAVPQVDALIRSFVEKGSDRATDLLLSGDFATFFSLTLDGSSYSGAFQESMRAVAMNDLSVRKNNRKEATTARILNQSQSVDFEFTGVNELPPGAQVDPPTSYGEPPDFNNLG